MLEAVREGPTLVTADTIAHRVWARDPTVARSTVYRALDALCRSGTLLAVRLDDAAIHYEIADAPHPHAVCQACSGVTHLPAEPIGSVVTEVSRSAGFVHIRAEIVVVGICAACASGARSRHR